MLTYTKYYHYGWFEYQSIVKTNKNWPRLIWTTHVYLSMNKHLAYPWLNGASRTQCCKQIFVLKCRISMSRGGLFTRHLLWRYEFESCLRQSVHFLFSKIIWNEWKRGWRWPTFKIESQLLLEYQKEVLIGTH